MVRNPVVGIFALVLLCTLLVSSAALAQQCGTLYVGFGKTMEKSNVVSPGAV